jgi:hypothetical protein
MRAIGRVATDTRGDAHVSLRKNGLLYDDCRARWKDSLLVAVALACGEILDDRKAHALDGLKPNAPGLPILRQIIS